MTETGDEAEPASWAALMVVPWTTSSDTPPSTAVRRKLPLIVSPVPVGVEPADMSLSRTLPSMPPPASARPEIVRASSRPAIVTVTVALLRPP